MNRSSRAIALPACLAFVAACGAEPASRGAVAEARSSAAAEASSPATAPSPSAEPATCGSGTLDSASALITRGGGCTPFDLGALQALQAVIKGDTSPAVLAKALQQLSAVNPEWAPVVNGGAGPATTPVLLHGTVLDSHLSNTDFPSTHVTIDQNTDILLDDAEAGCAATGNATAEVGGGPVVGPHLELEWEAGSYPAWAWAGPGDGIVALGRWIFDCGHEDAIPGACRGSSTACVLDSDCPAGDTCAGTVFNYRSELHPPQAVAVIRAGRGAPMPHGGDLGETKPIPVTRADVFVSGDGGGAGDGCVLTRVGSLDELLGVQSCFPLAKPLAPVNDFDFEFDVPLPDVPREGAPFWTVEQQADHAPAVSAEILVKPVLSGAPHLHVSVLMTKPVAGVLPTGFAGTIRAGWRHAKAPHLRHVRVTVLGIDIRDPLAHPAAALGLPNPHAWRVEASVDGEWQRFADVPAEVGFHAAGLVFDQWLPPHATLTVHAQAESEGCEDLVRGNSLSTIVNGVFGGQLLAAAGCDADIEIDDGEVDATFPGPRFGVRGAPYLVESAHGAWALKFRVERVEGDDS